jgi:Zn-dependent protease with chaperone function
MNFYEHQDRAERKTKIIVFLFVVAVICIVSIIAVPIGFSTEWNPAAIGSAVVVCLLIVGIATFVKLSQLKGGGQSVALMLGGTPLQREGANRAEQRVQNIVEEMAIASGMPVPPVYIIEDDGINAFAAGWLHDDAVIGVTRGCIEQLSRDELQGVIAHEFSHISHGDMRINIRLIGIIFGIMALGITGWILVRFIGPAVLRSSSRSRSKEGAGGAGIGLGIIVFGLFLALCGVIGTFFGRLIQAAVSRQREFLADASAVQYTRNPDGIGGALRKIGGMTPLKQVSSDVGQCNHMFFSQAMNAVFASHPPIQERIARVEGVDIDSIGVGTSSGQAPVEGVESGFSGGSVSAGSSGVEGGVSATPDDTGAVVPILGGFASDVVHASVARGAHIGGLHIQKAHDAIERIDPAIRNALQNAWSARVVMYALISNGEQRPEQTIEKILTDKEYIAYRAIAALVRSTDPIVRLPMIDLAAPALRMLSSEQVRNFNLTVASIVKSDGVVDHFEWVLVSVLQKHTSDMFGVSKSSSSRKRLSTYTDEIAIVLSAIAYCGNEHHENAIVAFESAGKVLGLGVDMVDKDICTMERVNTALKKLRRVRFRDKQLCIEACEACVTHDGVVTVNEAETIRAIGDILDCPIPMFT